MFLHRYPAEVEELPRHRVQYGFNTHDFYWNRVQGGRWAVSENRPSAIIRDRVADNRPVQRARPTLERNVRLSYRRQQAAKRRRRGPGTP